ncbi:MAG: 2'-5' RNA ligase family protein [Bacteroidia bacterium]
MYKKYFIAIVLNGELLEKAEQLKHELFERFGLKGALKSPAHITLHRPFRWKEEKETQLIETLSGFKYAPPFTIELDNFNCFTPRVIYIDLEKSDCLFDLHKQLTLFVSAKLKLLNEAEDIRGFHPHITIAFRDLKKSMFPVVWEEFKTRRFAGTIEVSTISPLKLDRKWEIHKSFNI